MSRVTDRIGPMVDHALHLHAQGEDACWEPVVMSDQQGQPHYILVFWFRGIEIGKALHTSMNIHDPIRITDEQVEDSIRQMVEQLRQARTQQLAQQQPDRQEQPSSNGLYLPGSN